jgi:hypothetical protein
VPSILAQLEGHLSSCYYRLAQSDHQVKSMRGLNQIFLFALFQLYSPLLYPLVRNLTLVVSSLRSDFSGSSSVARPATADKQMSFSLSDHKTVGTRRDIEQLIYKDLDKGRYLSPYFIDAYNIKDLLQMGKAVPMGGKNNFGTSSKNSVSLKRPIGMAARNLSKKRAKTS